MADDIDREPPVDREPSVAATPVPPPRRKNWILRILAVLVLGPVIVIGLWMAIALNYTYENGQHPGFVQKFSRTGWLCKTWEGELAMVNIPGAAPQIFRFSVRDEEVANQINSTMGRQVALSYQQHKGIPTSCFGETEFFVSNVRVVENGAQPAPPAPPVTPAGTGSNAPPQSP
jgi:hypothetical protein